MFDKLSPSQLNIVSCSDKRIVVKACPGSGKTFSVSARFARLLNDNDLNRHQGIAAISFTNTACEEIRNNLQKFGVNKIGYPHFIGTIDSFINNYIFLPYGHLLMKCPKRPDIVGAEYNPWFNYDSRQTIKNKDGIVVNRDPNYYFDKVSFDLDNKPFPIMPPTSYHFSWKKMINKDDTLNAKIKSIIEIKKQHFRNGVANQSDANYIAYKILTRYPKIAKNISQKFPILIIDEAQDTTAIQMAIVDVLDKAQVESILLVGDPHQAIFEWNTAEPSLFMAKYNSPEWTSLELSENRRSSNNICRVNNRFFDNNMTSVSEEDKDYPAMPEIIGHTTHSESINEIKDAFITECQRLGIDEENLAITYRGRKFGETHFGLINESVSGKNEMPWTHGYYYVRDLVHGKYLIDQGMHKKGFSLIERGYHKMREGQAYVSTELIKSKIQSFGFRNYRDTLFQFIQKLPKTNCTLLRWIELSRINGHNFPINRNQANINISNIFHEESTANADIPKFLKTIHSVKGMTLDAILVFLVKQDRSNYVTLLRKDYDKLTPPNQEQMRIVYVACTRPKKLLWIAVPTEDVDVWKNKLIK
jgi:superfamily I DNA/RNA helicase